MPVKVTNIWNRRRRLLDRGNWVRLQPNESHVMKRIDPSQEYIRESRMFKIEEVDDEGKKIKKVMKNGR